MALFLINGITRARSEVTFFCIMHMIRNSIKYVSHNCSKEFMADLKDIYKASTEEVAYQNLEKLQKKWEPK